MGFASPANEELADTVTVGDYLIRDKDASYLLRVEGNSLEEEGLIDGDMVVFERGHSYKPGMLVVVLGENGYTLQRLGSIRLVEVVGVVTGSFRSYI